MLLQCWQMNMPLLISCRRVGLVVPNRHNKIEAIDRLQTPSQLHRKAVVALTEVIPTGLGQEIKNSDRMYDLVGRVAKFPPVIKVVPHHLGNPLVRSGVMCVASWATSVGTLCVLGARNLPKQVVGLSQLLVLL